MKSHIEHLLHQSLKNLQQTEKLTVIPAFVQVDNTKDKTHGDFATNIAMLMAKAQEKKPRDIAEMLIQALPASPYIAKIEIAGPGFINFFLSEEALTAVIKTILAEKCIYGRNTLGGGKRILVEFLSSNPTGPLHVGHGRHGAFGDVVANLLDAIGFKVHKEYYVNDAGRQMDILAISVWLRYLELEKGALFPFPANAYRGQYVIDIARAVLDVHGTHFATDITALFKGLPKDEDEGGDKEIYIDALIERAKTILGVKYELLFNLSLENTIADIREDLEEFGVRYDHWFSERQLVQTNIVDELLKRLRENNHLYEKDGAVWFRAIDFGDEKDRVLVRANGVRTYFANDVAYHLSKFERGFDLSIDIFGADHHGYVPRIRAAMEALGINPERLQALLVQFVMLYRGKEPVQMSTRKGEFVTLRELRHEVGNDATRFFYVMRKADQHMDFDLNLAKSQSNENPVYYVQYAYARIASVFKAMNERGLSFNEEKACKYLDRLIEKEERMLITHLARYPEIIEEAALRYEPHMLTAYLRELAQHFHTYYNAHAFLIEDETLSLARLALILATKQILLNGFSLLGISAPESM